MRIPTAHLRTVVTRLCLNVLNSARRRRETCIRPWLPEPFFDPEGKAADDVTLPLMMALERLSPLERAAFLLHDVFGVGFDEIAATPGREAPACGTRRAGRGCTFTRHGRALRSARRTVSASPGRSSGPRAVAICRGCGTC